MHTKCVFKKESCQGQDERGSLQQHRKAREMQGPWENGFLPEPAHWFSFQPSPQLAATCFYRSTAAGGTGLVRDSTFHSSGIPKTLWVSVWLPGERSRGRTQGWQALGGGAGEGGRGLASGAHVARVCTGTAVHPMGWDPRSPGPGCVSLEDGSEALTVDARFGPIPQALSKTSCILSELKRIKDIPTLHLLTSPAGHI